MQKITNKSEFDQLIEKVKKCIEWYGKRNFEDKVYNLVLDNGEKLKIVFTCGSIAHLLGIDTEFLKTTGLFRGKSNEILEQVCNDSYRLYNLVKGGHIVYDNFISDFANEKVNSFEKICGIDLYNMEFICKYSKDNSYITGYQQLEGDYYIAYKAEDGLFIIGLKKNGDYYYPMTNRYIDFKDEESMEFLRVLLTNQTITMATYVNLFFKNTRSYGKNIYVDYIKKAHVIRSLKQYSNNYDSIIDVGVGYGFVIEKLLKKFEANSNVYPMLNIMFSYINRRVKINVKKLENSFGILPEEIVTLIESYNSSLSVSIGEAIDEHTRDITCERDRLREENQRHIKELEAAKAELLSAQALIAQLQEENIGYRDREAQIKRVLSI